MKSLWQGGKGHMLLVIAAGWFLSIGVRMIYPVLLPHLRTAYDFNLTIAGLLVTVLWLAYALGQLPGGLLADRIGEGTVMVVSTLIAAGMIVIVVSADSVVVLFVATAMFGFGTALYGVARFTILADIYPDQVGTATGLTMAAGDAGNSLLPPVAGFIAATLAWQYSFGFTIPLFLVATLALWIVLPTRTSGQTSAVDSVSITSVRRVLSKLNSPVILYSTLILILGNSIWQSFMGFYPTYLVDEKGFSTSMASVLFGLFFALGVVIKPLVGSAYDRIGMKRSLIIVISLMGSSLAILPFVTGFWPVIGATVLVSSLLGYGTIVLSHLTHILPDEMRGTGLGFIRTVFMTIAATSPVLFGSVADRGYFDEAFFVLAILSGAMIIITMKIPHTE